jgi:hypothetical protein
MQSKQTLTLCIIVLQILKEVDLGKSGDISPGEFVHAVTKMPDFATCFQLKV